MPLMNTKNSSTHTKQYRQVISAVHMVYRLVNSTYNLKELTLRLTRLLCQFIHADSASLYLINPDTQKIYLKAIFDNKINIFLNKKKDLELIPEEELKVSQGYPIIRESLIGLPLVADDYIGAVFVHRKRSPKSKAFDDFDKDMLAVVAEQSVTAIKNLQLCEQQQEVILSMIQVIQKVLETNNHSNLAAHSADYYNITTRIAEAMGLGEETIENLYYASILHDAGAMDVPYEILSKKSRLTSEEFEVIRDHPAKCIQLIKPVGFLKPILPIILYHHERYDGKGYPSGLKGERIPIGARIMAVVDAFEAMTTSRPYKRRKSVEKAIEELKKNKATQFDPKVVDVFIELSQEDDFRDLLDFENKVESKNIK